MKTKDALKLKNGQKIMHNRYGECVVREVMQSFGDLFGVVIRPTTGNGVTLLKMDSDVEADFLEDSVRMLSIENLPGSKPIDYETCWGEPESDLSSREGDT